MPFGIISGGLSVVSGLKGLFGKKDKAPTPARNLMSQAAGARQAADKYGFNPLTMLQYGQTGASTMGGGGSSPLASVDMITNGLAGLDDVFSGDKARRKAANELEYDLKKLQLETLRSGVASVGSTPSPLGGRSSLTTLSSPPVTMQGGLGGQEISDKRTRVMFGGLPSVVDEGTSDADEFEKRYSDIGGNIAGATNLINDYILTSRRNRNNERLKTGYDMAPLSGSPFAITPAPADPIPHYSMRPMPRQSWWQQRLNQPLRYNR